MNNIKVIILAGGYGTRLGRLTNDVPKPMVRIGSYPILWHIMKIYSHWGFKDFIIPLGYKSYVIKDYFCNYKNHVSDFTVDLQKNEIVYENKENFEDWRVSLINTGTKTLKGGRLKRIEKYLDNDVNMLTYGDGLADINLKNLLNFHKSHGKIITISGVRPPARFGELTEEKKLVTTFDEKPQSSVGLINGGFMVFHNEFMRYLTTDITCDFETSAMIDLVNDGEVMVYKHDGNWACIDHERDLDHLNNLWSNNEAFWRVW